MCILEDLVYGEVELFIEECRVWWEQWFSSIRAWKPTDVDLERLVLLRVSGIHCHACGFKLFKMVSETYGSFIKCDDITLSRLRMDKARILIKTNRQSLINKASLVIIDGVSFRLFLKE